MIRIMTDTAADITPAEAERMGVDLVRLDVRFPEYDYQQERDEDFSEFYRLLESAKQFPTTSQPSPEAFVKVYEAAKTAGDSVLGIMISSRLSGTMQSARIAMGEAGFDDVHLVDSRTAIMPQRILVEYAVKLRNAGKRVSEIVHSVESVRDRAKVYGMLDTLTYLYKGGRLSKTVAIAGNLLHIKPIVTTRDGLVRLVGRGRGVQALLSKLAEPPGFDPAFPVYFGYTSSREVCSKMAKQAREQFDLPQTDIFPIGALVGAHVGLNGCAVAFVTAEA